MTDFLLAYPVLTFLGALATYVAIMVIWDKVTSNKI